MDRPKILIVDDNDEVLRNLEKEFSRAKYEVVTANNGLDGLQILLLNHIDLVITDVIMPFMDGYYLCYKIRTHHKLKHIPVIIHTPVFASKNEENMATQMGADMFISKPYSNKILLSAAKIVLNRERVPEYNISPPVQSTETMHQYNSTLIRQLEEQNIELGETKSELEKTIARLKESQKIARLGHWEFDIENEIDTWSDEAYALLGGTPMEIIPSLESFLTFVHPDDFDHVKNIIDEGYTRLKQFEFSCRIIRLDGAIRHFNSQGNFDFDEGGKPIRIYGIIHDVTEKKLAEDQILKLNSELEERVRQRTAELVDANQQLEAFSYSVSHDLRSPLRSIYSFAQRIEKKCEAKMDTEGKELVGFIRESAYKMQLLIDDLLSFSRMGKKEIEKVQIDMPALANQIWQNLTSEISHAPGFEITEMPAVYGDRSMLTQVWVNFLSNAIKYSGKVSAPHVKAGGYIKDNEAIFYVHDNGAGFDMKYYNQLFGVFHRLHNSAEFEGTGVGLAIVKRIIDRHHGKVWAEGKVDEGATFYFSLPVTL
ncbi:MAG TPA: response regulator [Chitinophagales bacterium]|nr:response regulator [Chitinophagales bacterium]